MKQKDMVNQCNTIRLLASSVFMALLLMTTQKVEAQNDVFLSQQWLSRINQNPAATGNSDYLDVWILARRQWYGFDNAPETEVLNIHNYFHNIRSGLGLTGTRDVIGVGNSMINAKLAYAYHVNLGEKWLLSLGLSGGIMQVNYDPSKHYVIDGGDNDFWQDKFSKLSPDVDFGIELTSARFKFGASATHLLRLPEKQTTFQLGQQYHAYVSYRQPLGEAFDLIVGGRGSNFDSKIFYEGSLTAMYQKKYWLGAAFRPNNAVAAMVGVQIAFVRIGYAYDYSLGDIRSFSQNTHEIMISLRIAKPKPQINTKSPRFIEN